MNAPDLASFKDFARIAGFKPSYVTQLKGAGRLVLSEDGKRVRVAESLRLIADTSDPSKAAVAQRHTAARQQQGARDGAGGGAQAPVDDDSGEVITDPVQASDARRRAKALADKAETDAKAADRDYRLSMGDLLEAAQVVSVVQGAAATLRTSLENLPTMLAPELAAAADEARCRVLLQDAIEHALGEASRKFGALGRAVE